MRSKAERLAEFRRQTLNQVIPSLVKDKVIRPECGESLVNDIAAWLTEHNREITRPEFDTLLAPYKPR